MQFAWAQNRLAQRGHAPFRAVMVLAKLPVTSGPCPGSHKIKATTYHKIDLIFKDSKIVHNS